MLKYDGCAVVLQEVPDEITLAFNITGCPYHCVGCHSAYLQSDSGTPLIPHMLEIIADHFNEISCVAFMGGDHEMIDLTWAAWLVKTNYPNLSLCLYTGNDHPDDSLFDLFDYVKIGHYDQELGGLNSPTTNQRMYKHGKDITYKFYKRRLYE